MIARNCQLFVNTFQIHLTISNQNHRLDRLMKVEGESKILKLVQPYATIKQFF